MNQRIGLSFILIEIQGPVRWSVLGYMKDYQIYILKLNAIRMQKKEIEHLKELLKSKDETIGVLKGMLG